MNAVNRARVILALKVLAVLSFLAYPVSYLCDEESFSWIFFIVSIIDGAFAAACCLAGIIIIEAAHWYISDKEREAGIED